jgi:hypothetical protein
MLVPIDTPQPHSAHVGGALSSEPKGPMVHTPVIMALLICYLDFGSSARTRRRATCITAVSALSRRSCSQYSRTA